MNVVSVYMQYYNKETLENVSAPFNSQTVENDQEQEQQQPTVVQLEQQQQQIADLVTGNTQLTTADLLPKYDDASDFAKQNPVSKVLQEQNFLQAGYHIGINSTIQSNKIPYLDLRSAPPIAKQSAGPWNQSSYEEPMGAKRRYMEIGS